LKLERDKTNVEYNILLKKYFIDEFLRKLSKTKYANKFIWKGGFVLSAITGIEKRTTVDLDTLLDGINMDITTLTNIMNDVIITEGKDIIQYSLIDIKPIQEEKAYQGLRVRIQGKIESMSEKFHLDVTTGEKLDPSAIVWKYKPLLSNEPIELLIYRPERMLAEKLQTMLERGLANTRMKDFYDIYIIPKFAVIDYHVLSKSFKIVMAERHTLDLWETRNFVVDEIRIDERMKNYWNSYKAKNSFVGNISLDDITDCAEQLFDIIQKNKPSDIQ